MKVGGITNGEGDISPFVCGCGYGELDWFVGLVGFLDSVDDDTASGSVVVFYEEKPVSPYSSLGVEDGGLVYSYFQVCLWHIYMLFFLCEGEESLHYAFAHDGKP